MPDGKPKQHREKFEMPGKQLDAGIYSLRRGAEQISSDVNAPYRTEMAKLSAEKSPEAQQEGLVYLQKQLIDIVAANPELDNVKDLRSFAYNAKNVKNPDQAIALQKIQEVLVNPNNSTARQLMVLWPSIKKEGIEVRGGFGKRYLTRLKEKPVETLVYTIAGAAGVYLGLKAIKWLLGKAWESTKKKVKDKTDSIFSPLNIITALGILSVGGYAGRHKLENFIYEKFGIRIGKEKAGELVDDIKNGKVKEIRDLEKRIKEIEEKGGLKDWAKEKGKEKGEELKGLAIEKGKETRETMKDKFKNKLKKYSLLSIFGISIEKVDPSVTKEHVDFCNFIEKTNQELGVESKLFDELGNVKYEKFLKEAPPMLSRISSFWNIFRETQEALEKEGLAKTADQMLQDEELTAEVLRNYHAENLVEFFTTMVKNEGVHKDFKGKTINEVMRLIKENPGKYLDAEAVAEAKEVNEHAIVMWKMLDIFMKQAGKDKIKWTNEKGETKEYEKMEFFQEITMHATIAGFTFVIDKFKDNVFWVVSEAGNVLKMESELVYGAVDKLSDYMLESDIEAAKVGGAYLWVAKYTVAVGAPLGTVVGIGRTFKRTGSPLYSLFRGGIGGGMQGAVRAALFPAKVGFKGVKAVFWDKPFRGAHPLLNLESATIHETLFLTERLSLSQFGNKWLGMRSLTERIMRGEIEITKSLMRRLVTYDNLLNNWVIKYDRLASKNFQNKDVYRNYARDYRRAREQIRGLVAAMWDANNVKYNEANWGKYVQDNFVQKYNLGKEAKNILIKNKRLGIILMDKEHAITRFILNEKNTDWTMRLLMALNNKDQKLLNTLTLHPNLLNDHKVLETLGKLDPKTPFSFKDLTKTIKAREVAWKEFSMTELRLLGSEPRLTANYTQLIDDIARSTGKLDETAQSLLARKIELQKILTKPNTWRAKFIYRYADDLDNIFKDPVALKKFLEIDEALMRTIHKNKTRSELAELFADFTNKKKEIDTVIKETKIGITGKVKRGVDIATAAVGKKISDATKPARDKVSGVKKAAKAKVGEKVAGAKQKVGKGLKKVKDITPTKVKTAGTKLLSRFQGLGKAPQISKVSISEIDESITETAKILKTLQKKIKSLKIDRNLAKRVHGGKARYRAAQAIKSAKDAESAAQKHLRALNETKRLRQEFKTVKKGTKAAKELVHKLIISRGAVSETLGNANNAIKSIKGISKLATGFKWMGRGFAVGGTIASGIEAGISWHEAATTTVEGRAGLCAANATMWTIDTGVGVATVAVSWAGATGAVATIASKAALPLVVVTYAGRTLFEKHYEETNTEAEWAQNFQYDQLVHEWFTSQNSVTLGDALTVGFESAGRGNMWLGILGGGPLIGAVGGLSKEGWHDESIDKDMANKAIMAHKMFKSLVASAGNREVAQYIATESASDAKDKRLGKMIKENYSVYHEYYFRKSFAGRIQNYGSAKNLISKAILFDEIMQKRKVAKKSGATKLMLGHINFLNERYDITGDIQNLKFNSRFSPDKIIEAYNKQTLEALENMQEPSMNKNMKSMETPYLLYLYIQMHKVMHDNKNDEVFSADPNLAMAIASHITLIKNVLDDRNINLNIATQNPALHDPKLSLRGTIRHLEDLAEKGGSSSYEQYESNKFDKDPAVYAVYKLAQYYGFSGNANENELKAFFNEEAATYRGIYWDGESWYVQERGLEWDDEVGTELNKDTVDKMIKIIKENPDDIIEHRHDKYFLVDAYEFDSQASKMITALKNGYKEGQKKFGSVEKPVATAA
jgi:hypothetical protein